MKKKPKNKINKNWEKSEVKLILEGYKGWKLKDIVGIALARGFMMGLDRASEIWEKTHKEDEIWK